MSESAKQISDARGTKFTVSIVTNGTLLTQDILDRLGRIGGTSIQITIDGPRHIHDSRKPYANGVGSSFDAVMENLRTLDFGSFRVAIRCNIDKTNTETCVEMLPILRMLQKQGLFAYAAPVLHWPGVGCKDIEGICYSEPAFASIRQRFQSAAREAGVGYNVRPVARSHYCGGDMAYFVTVGNDGLLYKCWNHLGRFDLAVGDLLHGGLWSSEVSDWTLYDPTKHSRCSKCPVLPLCFGGCPDKRRVNPDGEHPTCDRWRYDLEQTLKDWVHEWYGQVNDGDRAIRNTP